MILFGSIGLFFFVFFLGLSISNIVQAQEKELKAKIEDRLKNSNKTITAIRIAKQERLSDMPFLDRLLQRMVVIKKIQNFISQSGLSMSIGSFFLLSLVLASFVFCVSVLFRSDLWLSFGSAFSFMLLPFLYIAFKRGNRIKRFSNRFPDSIGLIASSLRAGHSLQMAIETVVEDGKDVVAFEFRQVLSQVEVGQNFEDALKGMLTRVDLPELRLFISGVILQRETGGNLAELLDNLEFVIRERQQLRNELKSATAQAKFSGIILGLLPVFVGFFVFLIDQKYATFFLNEPIGHKLLGATLISQTLGILWIRKIVQIDI
jgi:tight adherence protein B